jgi:formate dehydrogenase major subunit
VIEPLAESRPDWKILCQVAHQMGAAGFDFAGPREIWDEIRSLWGAGAGISYARLAEAGLQWPCPAQDHPGTAVLHEKSFAKHRRAVLRSIDWRAPEETVSKKFPILLNTGRTLYQFNAGTMTMRTPNVKLRPTDTIDVSTSDAVKQGLRDAERVRVSSRYGSADLPVRVVGTLRPGEAFATFHTAEAFLNRVTGWECDSITGTPQYKLTAVRIDKVAPDEPAFRVQR